LPKTNPARKALKVAEKYASALLMSGETSPVKQNYIHNLCNLFQPDTYGINGSRFAILYSHFQAVESKQILFDFFKTITIIRLILARAA